MRKVVEKFENFIAKSLVKLTDLFTRTLAVDKSKVTFISYSSDVISSDMKLISNYLKEAGNYNLTFLIKKFDNTLINKFKYLFEFIIQTYHINTSRVVIIDGNNFAVSNVKKKEETTVIQIWHAAGAIKKFGFDFNRRYAINNYDYVITSSTSSKANFASAFNMPEDRILTLGVAKTDRLFSRKKIEKYQKQMYEKYPFIKDKKVVLYAPTFRGDGVFSRSYMDIDLDALAKSLGDEYIIMYKMHPISKYSKCQSSHNIINCCSESLYKLFTISELLVTDYSAIMYDYLILEKPIYFYAPDLQDYIDNRGIYWDFVNYVPGKVCFSEEKLAESIENNEYNLEKIKIMKLEFYDYLDGKSTERIGSFILSFLDSR